MKKGEHMKAVICERYGGPEVLSIQEVPTPKIGDEDILVRICASTVNSADVRSRSLQAKGLVRLAMRLAMGWSRPRNPILGNIYAGTIQKLGANVKDFRVGDRVFGCTPGMQFGCHAESVAVKSSSAIFHMPKSADYGQAASLLFGGTAALYFLDKADPKPQQSILIHGASRAVGSAAVQISRILGLRVTAVSSGGNEAFVRGLGATDFLDYTDPPFQLMEDQYHIVFDAVGKLDRNSAKLALKSDGTYLTVASLDVAKEDKKQLQRLAKWYEDGKFKAVIDRSYPVTDIQLAHRYVEEGHKKGNVVLKICKFEGIR